MPGAAALALLGLAPLCLSAWRHKAVPGLIERAAAYAAPTGVRWFDDGVWSEDPPVGVTRAVLLVHGLDEPGTIWDQLAPALAEEGHAVARFDYPNDQPARRSGDALAEALAGLRARGLASVPIVAHSMGGLLARDALTRPGADRPRTPTLITLGTPHDGSPWAAWQPAAEAREHLQRWIASGDRDPARLFAAWHDGLGGARDDLEPGSPYLRDLDERPWDDAVRVVCVVGLIRHAGEAVGANELAALPLATDRLGDGVVPASSAAGFEHADEVLFVRANHRNMVRAIEIEAWARDRLGAPPPEQPPAIDLVLDRLREP